MDTLDMVIDQTSGPKLSDSWDQERHNRYIFPMVSLEGQIIWERIREIHPLKQKQANAVYQYFLRAKEIKQIIFFGSSLCMRCNIRSDLDMCVELEKKFCNIDTKNRVSEDLQEICNWNADILWHDTIKKTDRIYRAITEGVKIE